MQSFQATGAPAPGPKNYVFVDEHNRHKRLKVMRACEGCRRRKIKCDAATTNTWPCAACKRLKLACVPPVGGIDGDLNGLDTDVDQFGSQPPSAHAQQYPVEQFQYLHSYGSQPELSHDFVPYDVQGSQLVYDQHDFYTPAQSDLSQTITAHPVQQRYQSFDSVKGQFAPQSVGSPQSTESITAEELAENLGDLRIADTGIAPYITQHNASQREASAPIVDDEDDLPAFSTAAGSQIRIPPVLMPSEEEAARSFQKFFEDVHPYVPVLCRSHFLSQWHNHRDSISPLLLEAVLACAGQVSDDPADGSQWLALANRHEESFADMPRLSTIQALLLLLKAREKAPKRGYYYRSWITVRKIVGMAKDLDLHEHFDIHGSDGTCNSTPAECIVKTRVWCLAMMVELMVGGPQGRSDYGVDIDTVDTSPSPPNSDIDEDERVLSRQFAFWARNVRNIRGITETYHKLKRKNKDWATDPKFVAYNEDFRQWPGHLPKDLNISISSIAPKVRLPSHFLANMHCHYQLGIVMLYKTQLNTTGITSDVAHDPGWKKIMATCYNSAKQVCAIQEAILEQYDVLGLACMLRGLSFPIYAILTCVMVHLIAITSPDASFNRDAKEYFVRHMRVLERCATDWQMPEVEAQINGLRAAFSADLRKPFELRPSFPYGTPSDQSKSPEERRASEPQYSTQRAQNNTYVPDAHHGSYYATPPASARPGSTPHEQPFYRQAIADQQNHQYHAMPPTSNPQPVAPTEPWNPTPIIDQFNTAFAIPQSALAPPPPSSYSSSPPVTLPQQPFHHSMQNPHFMPSPTSAGGYTSQTAYTPSPTSQPMPNTQSFLPPQSQVTPQPQLPPLHYQQDTSSYFDSTLQQRPMAQSQHHMQGPIQNYGPTNSFTSSAQVAVAHTPVYVTPKEWQQSVASVFDPGGLKRKWDYEQQLAMQQHGQGQGRYGSIG